MTKNAEGVLLKKSKLTTNGKPNLPAPSKLVEGELAINYAEGVETISTKNESGTVVTFSSDDYYTAKKLGDYFTGENSAKTVTEVMIQKERVTAEALIDLDNRKVDFDDIPELWLKGTATGAVRLHDGSTASGQYSVAEGVSTKATASYTHAEGLFTEATSSYAHAEGYDTEATNNSSHAEGRHTIASGQYSHSEGVDTEASGKSSHAEGSVTRAYGQTSHAEGSATTAISISSHAEGKKTVASGDSSHAEGAVSYAYGDNSHAEGFLTKASGESSHAEGYETLARGQYSHSEGYETSALTNSAHAEGNQTLVSGACAHSEGLRTKAYGDYSHAEGACTRTINYAEHASGYYNASSSASTTFGNAGNTLFSVGNGTDINKHNTFEIRQNGDIYIADVNASGEHYEKPMIKLQDKLINANNYYTKSETSGASEISTALNDKVNVSDVDQVINSTTSANTNPVSTSAVYGFVTSYTPSITVDQVINETTSGSSNPVSTKAVYSAITDNEMVWANAYVTISGAISSHTENTDVHVTAADKTAWGNKADGNHTHDASGITAMTGYQVASSSASVLTTDTLLQTIGKLEKRIELLEAALGGMTLVKLTSQQYADLAVKDPNTLYIIND